MTRFTLHFSHLPVVQRVLYTSALSVFGLAYLFAMIHIYSSHHNRDGDPMLTVEDIVIAYSGSKSGTKLEAALKGPMSGMLPADENLKIIDWAREGASEKGYKSEIKSIMDHRCVTCHNNRNPHLPSLEDYSGVQKTTEEDRGADLFTLVRVSHIHLFGLTFIFFLIGGIFIHSYIRYEWLKITMIVLPFVAIIVDVSSWYITKYFEPFAWVVIGSGALMGLSFAFQFTVSMYQMWFYKLPENVQKNFYCAVTSEK